MKGKKRIGILALSLAFIGVASSCGEYKVVRNTTPEEEKSAVVVEDTDRTELKSIVLDTSKTRKVFYVGEEFNSDGLIVNRSLAVYSDTNFNKGMVYMPTKDFTVDSSEVDTSKVGTYKVTVTHRLGNRILTQSYNVSVKPSVFESTAGLTYNAGLEVNFADGKRIKEYLLHDKYIEKYADDYDHDFNLYNLLNGLSIKLHKWTSDGKEAKETRVMSLTPDQVSIDTGGVDIDKVGTYVVKVTYETEDIVIDGVSYSNNADAFLVIDVVDPIESIKINSGTAIFTQSIDGIDVEAAGWTVYVKPVVSDSYVEPFTYDKYQIDGVDIFKVDKSQDITVSLIEDSTVKCTKGIKITKSTTQDIVNYTNLTPDVKVTKQGETLVSVDDVLLAGTTFIHGPLPQKVDNDNYLTTGATYATGRTSNDSYGSISFDVRITMKGTSQAVMLELSKPGKLVVFCNTTSEGDERDIALYGHDSEENKMNDEALQLFTLDGVRDIPGTKKASIDRVVFDIPSAGKYYIANPNSGVWLYGFILATDK